MLHNNSYELSPLDSAVEVTSDFKIPADISPTKSSSNILNPLHKSMSSDHINKTVTQQDLELISHYINLDTENGIKVSEDLEVIRTKVVRRTKRSSSQIQPEIAKVSSDNSSPSANETNVTLEHRLSKATTDSGLCLETPYSSDGELTDVVDDGCNSNEGEQIMFEVGNFCHDINVTFSTPIKDDGKQIMDFGSADSSIEERGIPEGQEDPIKNICASNQIVDRLPLQSGNDGVEEEEDSEEELSIYDMCKISAVVEKCDTVLEQKTSVSADTLNDDKSVCSTSSTRSYTVDVVYEELSKLALEKQEALSLK